MQIIGQFQQDINVIPNNMEKYTSFSIGTERMEWDYNEKKTISGVRHNLTFIDSLQFMPYSLSELTENLKKSGLDQFKYIKEEFESLTDMMTKMVFILLVL